VEPPPPRRQILNIAYKSGVRGRVGLLQPEFDALLARANAIVDADARREVMAEIEALMQADGVLISPTGARFTATQPKPCTGREQNPTIDHHHYKWWIAA
jgi:peptide/nickel transport system substrate-binding protein